MRPRTERGASRAQYSGLQSPGKSAHSHLTSVRLEFGPDIAVECPHAPSPSGNIIEWKERRMKNGLLTLTTLLISVGAFGQGKLLFQVDSTQLIYLSPYLWALNYGDTTRAVAGFPLAGSSLYTGSGSTVASLAGAPSFTVGLWGGPTAGSMTLQATTTLGDVSLAGQLNPVNVTFAGLPAGTAAFFQIQVYDSRATSAMNAWITPNPAFPFSGLYAGESPVFSATPQASVYSPIYQSESPVNSTLPVGTFVPVDYAAYPG